MPIEYTDTGRIKRVQADSILETKLVINEMQKKKQEYETLKKQLALDSSLMRGNYRNVNGQPTNGVPLTLVRTRLDQALLPLELKKLEIDRIVTNMDQCICQLDTYLSQIIGNGLSQHDFCLHYQPIVELNTGQISGFEALVRWQRAQQGFTFPAEFIPIAEETGLIVHLDRWVLLEACRQLRTWQDQFPDNPHLTVSVNLSGAQLVEPDFVDYIADVLKQTQLEARHLKLEVSESALVQNIGALQSGMDQLRSLGLRLNIDDFGAGDTTLNYFHQLPFGALIMDRSLMSRIESEDQSEHLQTVESIIQLAQSRQMGVVAKGVETPTQLAKLRSLSGEYAQGYLFSKPVDTDTASQLIAHGGHW